MTLYLVRHAEARHNLPDPASCPFDPAFAAYEHRDHSLTPEGERQADLTGRLLSTVSLDAVLVSPYHRTLSTAAAILRHQTVKRPFELSAELEECGSDHFQAMPPAMMRRIYPDILPFSEETALGHEEDHDRFCRAQRVAERIRRRFTGKESVLVVSHGHFLGFFLTAALLGLSEETARGLCLGARNAGVTRIQYTDSLTILDCLNESVHIAPLKPLE